MINDITFFPSKFSDADTIKNEKNSLFAKFLGLFSGFLLLKVKIMSFLEKWAIKPTNPFEKKKNNLGYFPIHKHINIVAFLQKN